MLQNICVGIFCAIWAFVLIGLAIWYKKSNDGNDENSYEENDKNETEK